MQRTFAAVAILCNMHLACIYGHPVVGLLPGAGTSSADNSPLLLLGLLQPGGGAPVALSNLSVTATTPAASATAVRLRPAFSLQLNEALDPDSLAVNTSDTTCSGTLQVSCDGFASCRTFATTTISTDRTTLTFSLSRSLDEGVDCTVRLTSVRDGQGLVSGNVWDVSFRTFSPALDIGGELRLWLKAGAGVEGDDPVSAWNDQSGNGVRCTQQIGPTYPLPTLLATSSEIGDRPAMQFSPQGDQMICDNEPLFDIATPSIFVVGKHYSGSGALFTGKASFAFGTSDPRRRKLEMARDYVRSGGDGNTLTVSDPGVEVYASRALVSGSNTNHTVSVNGSVSTSTQVQFHDQFNDEPFRLGGQTSDNHISGEMAEVLVFATALSEQQRLSVECYLKDKYAFGFALSECN